MTWTAFHRRAELLRDILDDADRTARTSRPDLPDLPELPWGRPGVAEAFHDRLDLVGALQLRWYTALSARVEAELERRPRDPADAVRRARAATAQDHPGLRALLDRQLAAPDDVEIARALARAGAKEQAMLDRASRPAYVVSRPARSVEPRWLPTGSSAFVARLKAALAAA